MTAPVIIVGASMGGLRAAEALRRNHYKGPITFFGAESHAPYNRPPLSKEMLAGKVSPEAVTFRHNLDPENTKFIFGTRIVELNEQEQVIVDEFGQRHPYSALIISTGLRPKRLKLETSSRSVSHVLRTLDDAIALKSVLVPNATVVVIGAGFIGAEVASTAATLGCDVTVVSSGNHPLERPLGTALAREIQRRHELKGVKFLLNKNVTQIDERTDDAKKPTTRVTLDCGTTLECDVLVEAIGSEPNVEWLHQSGIDLTDGVLTDAAMRALDISGRVIPNIYAVGDVARFPNHLFDGTPRRVEHWNIPIETAKRAAQVLAAQMRSEEEAKSLIAEPFLPIPSFWSDQFDIKLLAFGNLALADEQKLLEGDIQADSVWGYYRDGQFIGVCGIGMGAKVRNFRNLLAERFTSNT